MTILEIILIALGLSMDCFAVAVGFGTTRKLSWILIFRMAFFFGLFQGLMPLIGWLIGDLLQVFIDRIDHWIAFSILAFIGLKMIFQSFKTGETKNPVDIRSWPVLLSLSVATSIDALITGVGFGFIRVNIVMAVLIITGVTFIVTVTGARIGEHSTFIPARRAELLGGVVLIAIGTKIFLDHLGLF
jgi:putative Mn2+ efflux pump MntP